MYSQTYSSSYDIQLYYTAFSQIYIYSLSSSLEYVNNWQVEENFRQGCRK